MRLVHLGVGVPHELAYDSLLFIEMAGRAEHASTVVQTSILVCTASFLPIEVVCCVASS